MSLSKHFASPVLYNDELMIQCLSLLAVSTNGSYSLSHRSSRPTSVWLRGRLTVAVQAVVLEHEPNFAAAAVVALLVGWELVSHWGHRFKHAHRIPSADRYSNTVKVIRSKLTWPPCPI